MSSEEAYVYIMASTSGTLYVGSTLDIESRVRTHKANALPGFSSKYRCHKLVYYLKYAALDEARMREYQIKGWRREKKENLIRKQNPTWCDLSRFWEEHL
jgi:putative endonuclease